MAAIESPLKERITPERLLDLRGVLDDLVRAKIVTQRDAEDILIAPRTAKQLHMHPLEIIAERELDDPRRPGKKLDLDELTHWLCEISGAAVLPHRPAEGERQQDDRSDVVRVRAAAQHPRRRSARRRNRHRQHAAVHVGVGRHAGSDAARPAHRSGW